MYEENYEDYEQESAPRQTVYQSPAQRTMANIYPILKYVGLAILFIALLYAGLKAKPETTEKEKIKAMIDSIQDIGTIKKIELTNSWQTLRIFSEIKK